MANKRNQVDKMPRQASKKAASAAEDARTKKRAVNGLKTQYEIIKEDLIKLRSDLFKGYALAKGLVERKEILGSILNEK